MTAILSNYKQYQDPGKREISPPLSEKNVCHME